MWLNILRVVALVPLAELREPDLVKKYGLKFDPEVLGMVDTISRQKEVSSSLCFSN